MVHGDVDVEGVDFPVSVRKCLGVLIDDWRSGPMSMPLALRKGDSQSLQDNGEQPLAGQTAGDPAQSP